MIYELGAKAASRRAAAASAVGAVTALAPVVLALELLPRLGWSPSGMFWAVAAAIGALVVARTASQYTTARRRLASLRVTIDDDAIATATSSDALTVPRERIARIVEVHGALGGLRVESQPDPRSGVVLIVSVPRGGDRFGDVRAALERWRPIDRRPRLGVGVRVLSGAAVVAAVFFLPFLLDDFVARSKLVAGLIVLLAWAVARWTMRGR
ncbi:MAG TPA: hypothetical protein VK762_25590 [Polyangiaceae bacterium]|nr:hypothetical protein [Polyangiaceae bacterium]